MRSDVAQDYQKSLIDAARALKILEHRCPEWHDHQTYLIDGRGSRLARHLDNLAGLDAYECDSTSMRGVAMRVQYGFNYRTHTIRETRPKGADTELEKRQRALTEGHLYPFWTVQAYFERPGGPLLSVGLAKSEELYAFVASYPIERKLASNGGEGFLIVSWSQYRYAGYYLFEYSPPAPPSSLPKVSLST
jgi:hypothetical protein